MNRQQLSQFFRQKVRTRVSADGLRAALEALADFAAAQGGVAPDPDPTPKPDPTPDQRKRMAVCLLDSTTFGLGSDNPATDSWPAQLAPLATATYGLVVNKGVSGNSTDDGLYRIQDIVSAYNFEEYAGVDVLFLGGVNNLLLHGENAEQVLAKYPAFFAALKAPNPVKVRLYQLTLPAAIDNRAPTAQADINDINAAIRLHSVAQYGATAVIDLARRVEMQHSGDKVYFDDPVHPNRAGYTVIASTVAAFLSASTQPTGPVLSNSGTPVDPDPEPQPDPAADWVAPTSGDSAEYDVAAPGWAKVGVWVPVDSTVYYADASGAYSGEAGAVFTSPRLLARTVRVVAARASFGGESKLELVTEEGQVVAAQTVSLRGSDAPATFVLSLPSVQVVRLRMTCLASAGFLSGIILSRSAS